MIELDEDGAEVAIKDEIYLLDFSALWCGPCKAVTPVLDKLSVELNIPIYKVDIDTMPKTATTYGIRAIPTVVKMMAGKEVSRITGSYPIDKYRDFITK